jgi:hypothetical protein
MTFISTIFLFPPNPTPTMSSMNYTVVVLGSVMAGAVAWYYCPVYGGVHWFKGPRVTAVGSGDAGSDTASRQTKASKLDGISPLVRCGSKVDGVREKFVEV